MLLCLQESHQKKLPAELLWCLSLPISSPTHSIYHSQQQLLLLVWWQCYTFGMTHAKRAQWKMRAVHVLSDNKSLNMDPSWQWSPKLQFVDISILRTIQILLYKSVFVCLFIYLSHTQLICWNMFFIQCLHSGYTTIRTFHYSPLFSLAFSVRYCTKCYLLLSRVACMCLCDQLQEKNILLL